MLFDRTSEGLAAATRYSGIRHKTIANNIANVDTPGYRALDVSFREQLSDFMRMQNSHSGAEPLLPPTVRFMTDLNSRRPRIDGNTVSIDQQLAMLSQNAIYHNACLELLHSKFRILKTAITLNT